MKSGSFLKLAMLLIPLLGILVACSGVAKPGDGERDIMTLDEPFRPQFHFTPAAQWMNDPNGLVFYAGEYHLFYQHSPDDTVWGPMHWGHAVSPDLVNWQHLPIALYPDEQGAIFSGSAVVDWNNTAGFGEEALVAIFTHHQNGRESQSLAYSTDNGRTWTKYADNPVLPPPNNIRNFRDPKVFWHEGDGGGHWVMAVAAGNIVLFFTSDDLKEWQPSGGFGLTHGATCGVWETPDLFELPVDGGPETRWVLAIGTGDCAPAGGSGAQYFVGHFDGATFTSEVDPQTALWVDHGADFYAPQSWNDVQDGRRFWAAWMNNWRYAQDIPTSTWRGALTLPRELSLARTPDGIRLRQAPVAELENLRDERWSWSDVTVSPDAPLDLADVEGETLEITAAFRVPEDLAADRFGLRLRAGDGEQTVVGYATKAQSLFVDRSQSGQADFNAGFPGIHTADLAPADGLIHLHIFVDRSSVEVFANDGQVVFTERIFPSGDSLGLELFAEGGPVVLEETVVYRLEAMAVRDGRQQGGHA